MKIFVLLFSFFIISDYPGDWYIKDYYENGNLREEGWLLKKQKTAYWFTYHQNGKVATEGNYAQNQKTGWWKHFDDSGNLISIGKYEQDNKDYFWKYFKNSKLIRQEKWQHGELIWKTELSYQNEHKGTFQYFSDDLKNLKGFFVIENKNITLYSSNGKIIHNETILN